ncbi:MAG: type IX secretion system plug protein domain-containing protein [Bacteroidia bacterium]
MKYLLLLCYIALQTQAFAQDLLYDNQTYLKNIATVRFFAGEFENAYPMTTVGIGEKLTLSFDQLGDFESSSENFRMDILSCDADWQPSNLMPIEFYEGNIDKLISDYTRSSGTRVPYLHYQIQFPEEGESFKMSGNYLLRVYQNSDENDLVFTRRFVVAEQRLQVVPQLFDLPARGFRVRLQKFNFEIINNAQLPITNPNWDLKVVLMQNGRWDNTVTLNATFNKGGRFEYRVPPLKDLFPTGNEFRRIDTRNTKLLNFGMQEFVLTDTGWNAYLPKEHPRLTNKFAALQDFNGGYIVESDDAQYRDYEADYVHCHFTLKVPDGKYDDLEVYVNGGFSGWTYNPINSLIYNEELRQYEATIPLKQGFYDYQYVVRNPITKQVNETLIEGERMEEENFYTILVYYKGFGDRNHRLVASQPVNY